ncbi:hypothetical protein [Paracoccus onubensis]|uniref:Uncharacterized protein n=1 Tax=Paracoccus onubensis TaxID=1675788 RepID=A0A418SSR7_9RHOB|nr:hypothetical protein [Paracoccus onubensis]RJE84006.1 hypothetical protein D3P04_13390 [Paracoccus onubensis]
MTDRPTFTPEQLREAYAFQVKQTYSGDLGTTAAAMYLLEKHGVAASDDMIERLAAEIGQAVEASHEAS